MSPVPLEAYDDTEYPATVAVTPETLPFNVSLNQTATESILPLPSESRVFLETIFGATPSDTEVVETAARALPDWSATVHGTYANEYGLAVSVAVESAVRKRYVLEETCELAPVYVEVPLNDIPVKSGDWSVSVKVTSTE